MFRRGSNPYSNQVSEEQVLWQKVSANYERIKGYFLSHVEPEINSLEQFDRNYIQAQFQFYSNDYAKSIIDLMSAKKNGEPNQVIEMLILQTEEKYEAYEKSFSKAMKYIIPRMYLKLVEYTYPHADLFNDLTNLSINLESTLDQYIQFPHPQLKQKMLQYFDKYHEVWMKCNSQKIEKQTSKKRKAETSLIDPTNKRTKLESDIPHRSTMELPLDQWWLIDRISAMDYKVDIGGMCYGISGSHMVSALVGDEDLYYTRLQKTYEIPTDQFNQHMENNREIKLDIIRKAKQHAIETLSKVNFDQFAEQFLQNQSASKALQAKFESLQASIDHIIDVDERNKIYITRRNELIQNLYIQQVIDEQLNCRPEQNKADFETLNFFDSLVIFHKVKDYSYLYSQKDSPLNQNILNSEELVQSIKLKEQGGLVEIDKFYGTYQLNELTTYFSDLITLIQQTQLDKPFGLMLGNVNHAISITFRPTPNGLKILFMNPNISELANPKYELNLYQLSDYVLRSFTLNDATIFTTKMYGTKANEELLINFNEKWKNKRADLHAYKETKATTFDSDHTSLLHIAAREGDCELMKKLLNSGVNVNAQTKSGCTPLFLATQNGQLDAMKLLIENMADINLEKNECTPLQVAVSFRKYEAFVLLLKQGANLMTLDGCSILHDVCFIGASEFIEPLTEFGIDLNHRNNDGNTPLMIACRTFDLLDFEHLPEQLELINKLLKNGASVHLPDLDGNTPLYYACINSNFDLLQLLLSNKASVHVKNQKGNTPLLHLCEEGFDDSNSKNVIQLLVSHGADINAQNNQGYTALHLACKNEQHDMAHFLLEKHAYLNVPAKNGFTPLHIAILKGNSDLVDLLLTYNADMTYSFECSLNNFDVLAAKFKFQSDMIQYIKQKSPTEQGCIRITPHELAQLTGNLKLISLLEQYKNKDKSINNLSGFTRK